MRSDGVVRAQELPAGHRDPEGLGGRIELQISPLDSVFNGGWIESWRTAGILPLGEPIVSHLQGGVMSGAGRGNRKVVVNPTQAREGYPIRWRGRFRRRDPLGWIEVRCALARIMPGRQCVWMEPQAGGWGFIVAPGAISRLGRE